METRYFSMDYLIKKVSFGKYKDKYTLIDIFTHDNSYALWLLNNFEFAPGLKGVLRDSLHIKDNTKREKFLLEIWEKYSLQGTTQSRYLTGGVPPVRFSM